MTREQERIWNNAERLKWWTLEKLYGADIRQLDPDDAHEIMAQHSRHRQYVIDRAIGTTNRLRRNIKRDPAILVAMPSLARYVRPRPAHRPKGSEPGLAEAWREVKRIREIWRREFGRYNRNESPTAVELAAWRHDFDPEAIRNYGNNLSRRKT